jgi:hypothetical protein
MGPNSFELLRSCWGICVEYVLEYDWQDQSLDNGHSLHLKLLCAAHLRSQLPCFNSYRSSRIHSQQSSPSYTLLSANHPQRRVCRCRRTLQTPSLHACAVPPSSTFYAFRGRLRGLARLAWRSCCKYRQVYASLIMEPYNGGLESHPSTSVPSVISSRRKLVGEPCGRWSVVLSRQLERSRAVGGRK